MQSIDSLNIFKERIKDGIHGVVEENSTHGLKTFDIERTISHMTGKNRESSHSQVGEFHRSSFKRRKQKMQTIVGEQTFSFEQNVLLKRNIRHTVAKMITTHLVESEHSRERKQSNSLNCGRSFLGDRIRETARERFD